MWKHNFIQWYDNIAHSNPPGSSADSLGPATLDTTTVGLAIKITNVAFNASLLNPESEFSKTLNAEVTMLVKPLTTTTPEFWDIRTNKMSKTNKQTHPFCMLKKIDTLIGIQKRYIAIVLHSLSNSDHSVTFIRGCIGKWFFWTSIHTFTCPIFVPNDKAA